jgi:hypothetical protein
MHYSYAQHSQKENIPVSPNMQASFKGFNSTKNTMDSVVDSPRSNQRRKWQIPSNETFVLQPNSYNRNSIQSDTDDSLSVLVEQFSNQPPISPITEHSQALQNNNNFINYRRVNCSENRVVPSSQKLQQQQVMTPRSVQKRESEIQQTNNKRRSSASDIQQKKLSTTSKKMKESLSKTSATIVKTKPPEITERKKPFIPTLSLPTNNEHNLQSPRSMMSSNNHVVKEDVTNDPYIITQQERRGTQLFQYLVGTQKIPSQQQSPMIKQSSHATKATMSKLIDLSHSIRSQSLENNRRILEIQLANLHLKLIEKRITELVELVKTSRKRDWCSITKQFHTFYTQTIESRNQMSKGIQLSHEVDEADLMNADCIMASPRQIIVATDELSKKQPALVLSGNNMNNNQSRNLCVTKDGTTVRRTAASIVTTKVSSNNLTSPRIHHHQHQTATVSSSAQKPLISPRKQLLELPNNSTPSLDQVRHSYTILLEECMTWFMQYIQKHVQHFLKSLLEEQQQQYPSNESSDKAGIDTIRLILCPWFNENLSSSSIDQNTRRIMSQLVDQIDQFQFKSSLEIKEA